MQKGSVHIYIHTHGYMRIQPICNKAAYSQQEFIFNNHKSGYFFFFIHKGPQNSVIEMSNPLKQHSHYGMLNWKSQ